MDIKQHFLSLFAAYAQRIQGCSAAAAQDYAEYVRAANNGGMRELGHQDYLLWLAECSRHDRAQCYVQQLRHSVMVSMRLADRAKKYYLIALSILERFVDETFGGVYLWPQYGQDHKKRSVIRYENGIDTSEQVPGLYVALKNEYLRIVELAQMVFGKMLDETTLKQIPVTLSAKRPVAVYELSGEYLEKLRHRRQEREDLTEEEDIALRDGKRTCAVLGEFRALPTPRITLYYRNLQATDMASYVAALANVLAHEYMHYLHACYCEKVGETATLSDDSIGESMADFFSMLYSLHRDRTSDLCLALRRYWAWAKWWDSGWPYAYALCFYTVKGKETFYSERLWDYYKRGCIEKLTDVLALCDCPTKAHDTLLM